MKAANFDSLTYANRLKAAGMDGGLAEVQASALTEVIQDHFQSLSTKQEVQQLSLDLRKEIQLQGQDLRKDMQLQGQELRKDMQLLRLEVQKDMQLLEQRMVIKLGSLMVLAIGVVATVVKLI
ncbi:MAG: hypothetical protein NWQ05_03810 [Burkholderiaceae bacterium]|jgi:hypothetical protein|nr:hypothetical protein [Burkholderiaceae bacterium]